MLFRQTPSTQGTARIHLHHAPARLSQTGGRQWPLERTQARHSLPVEGVAAESVPLQASKCRQAVLAQNVQEGCHPHAVA